MKTRYFGALLVCFSGAVSAAEETSDTPGAIWAPAAAVNFGPANRPTEESIDYVVIHDIEGSAEWAVSWFQNPQAGTSAHYVVNATTIWQMVKERDVAWHAGNRDINHHSIGIEHEGYAGRPGFYDSAEYETSARLVREITSRYSIPRDRQHIFGHAEVPNPNKPGLFGGANGHTDPGPYWDWASFMFLVRNDAKLVDFQIPEVIHPGEILDAVARFTNTGDDMWPVYKTNETPPPDGPTAPVPVYLGTANPVNRASVFFDYKGWASPRMATMAESETAPNAIGRFSWKIRGPNQLGTFTEAFRLTKVPFAPSVPVGFGETLSTTIRVEPWDIMRIVTSNNPVAVPLPLGGLWDVYVSRPLTSAVLSYQVTDASGVQTVAANGTGDDKGWIKLGHFRFDDPKSVAIKSLSDRDLLTVLRFVGPFPPS
jgi:N-acetyl-anhydromuramyl-L-alanine amidase AmpD